MSKYVRVEQCGVPKEYRLVYTDEEGETAEFITKVQGVLFHKELPPVNSFVISLSPFSINN